MGLEGAAGQWHQSSSTWVIHVWLLNDSVDPPIYLPVPAVLDPGADMSLFLTRRDAQKLQLAEDIAETHSLLDLGGNKAGVVAYRPVQIFVPMLDKPDGQLSFYKHGWLQPQSSQPPVGSEFDWTVKSLTADQAFQTAGQQVLDKVNDKSNAWVQASPSRHPSMIHRCSSMLYLDCRRWTFWGCISTEKTRAFTLSDCEPSRGQAI